MRTKQSYIDCGRLGAKKRWDNEPPMEVRFWNNVKKGLPDECWVWIGPISKMTGYGKTKCLGKETSSHRVAWELTFGPIPTKMCICHKCDNRPCCNPGHLFLGSHRDNIQDAIKKGRIQPIENGKYFPHFSGQSHPMAKLDDEKVREIRERFKNGQTNKAQLARQFNVCPSTINRIIKRLSWSK